MVAIAAVAFSVLLESDSAAAALRFRSDVSSVLNICDTMKLPVSELMTASPCRPAISVGVPVMVDDIVEFDVVFENASTVTGPVIGFALVPSEEPRVALAEVLMLLIAIAPPTPPLSAGLSRATDVADVEKLLLLSA